jgi:hypothetical protein
MVLNSRHIALLLFGAIRVLSRTHAATRTIRRGFTLSSRGTGLRLPLSELLESIIKPLQIRLAKRDTALQCEEREKGLVVSFRPLHFLLQFCGSFLTHCELLRNLFPAFFQEPQSDVMGQHMPKERLE